MLKITDKAFAICEKSDPLAIVDERGYLFSVRDERYQFDTLDQARAVFKQLTGKPHTIDNDTRYEIVAVTKSITTKSVL